MVLFAVFTKDYGFRNFRKHSETFGKFRRSVIRLYNFYILYRCSNVILVIFLSPLWYFWPQILCKVIKSTKWFRIFRNVSETFGNINPSWKRLLCSYDRFISCCHSKTFLLSINEMVYDINFTAPNNQLNFKCLVGHIWYLHSNMSVGVVSNDFDYALGPCLCRGNWLEEIKR